MGCVNTKIQSDDQTCSSENSNTCMEDTFDLNLNIFTDKIVDVYDLPYKGKDEIL